MYVLDSSTYHSRCSALPAALRQQQHRAAPPAARLHLPCPQGPVLGEGSGENLEGMSKPVFSSRGGSQFKMAFVQSRRDIF